MEQLVIGEELGKVMDLEIEGDFAMDFKFRPLSWQFIIDSNGWTELGPSVQKSQS